MGNITDYNPIAVYEEPLALLVGCLLQIESSAAVIHAKARIQNFTSLHLDSLSPLRSPGMTITRSCATPFYLDDAMA